LDVEYEEHRFVCHVLNPGVHELPLGEGKREKYGEIGMTDRFVLSSAYAMLHTNSPNSKDREILGQRI